MKNFRVINIVFSLFLTFLWFLCLFIFGIALGALPLPYGIVILIFYVLAGVASLYLTFKPTEFRKQELIVSILSFFSVALMPLIRYILQTSVRRRVIYLLFVCGILLWHYEVAFILRALIGGKECDRGVMYFSDLKMLGISLNMYQCDYQDFYSASFSQLYQDNDAVNSSELTLYEAERQYRYLPPEKYPVEEGTILAYLRKPHWHFHSFEQGNFRTFVLYEDGIVNSITIPKNRYNSALRKIFFWYFINTPFEGPEELTPEEVQEYHKKQKIER